MIVQIIGWFCLIGAMFNIFGSYLIHSQGNIDGSRWSFTQGCLMLIAAAICFK